MHPGKRSADPRIVQDNYPVDYSTNFEKFFPTETETSEILVKDIFS